MTQLERQQKILSILKSLPNDSSVSVKELADRLDASESSVRRDLISMESRGLVTHIYGGVMQARRRDEVIPVGIRDSEQSAVKDRLAAMAARLIEDGDTVFFDSSSTVARMLKYIDEHKKVRIITNNQRLFGELDRPNLTLYCTGGTYDPKNHNFLGMHAEEYVRRMRADIAFFSSMGLSADGEINDISESEVSMKRTMLSRARRKVFLCDSEKVGVEKFITLCKIDEVDDIICDKPELIEKIKAAL